MGLRLLHNRLFSADTGTAMTASAHEADWPAANLRNADRKVYAQASTRTPYYYFALAGVAAAPLDTLVLVNTDLTPGATARITASNLVSGGSEALNTGHLPVWTPMVGPGEGDSSGYLSGGYLSDADLARLFPAGVVLTVDFPQTTACYWQIAFNEPSRAKPRIGVLYLCRRWEFVYQPNLGGLDSWTDDRTSLTYAEDGSHWMDGRPSREMLDLECTVPENAAWWGGKNHFKEVGVGRPFVIDPVAKRPPSLGARAWSRIYGHFTALPRVESEGHFRWTVAMQVTETL